MNGEYSNSNSEHSSSNVEVERYRHTNSEYKHSNSEHRSQNVEVQAVAETVNTVTVEVDTSRMTATVKSGTVINTGKVT